MLQVYLQLLCELLSNVNSHFCLLTSSKHQHVDLDAHRLVFEDVHHLRVAHRLDILSVDLLDDIALQQATAPLGVQDHLHLLAQRAICDGEAEATRAFYQRHAHQLWLQQSGVRAFLVGDLSRSVVVVLVGMSMVMMAPSVGHGWCSSLPGEGCSIWDCVVGFLRRGGRGGRGSILGGAEASRRLLTAAGILRQGVAPAQDHVHILVDWDALEHLHHISMSLPQHTCPIDVHNHVT